jgi:short-subunit dehydrogenase
MLFKDKIAIVTGASKGIGRATAVLFGTIGIKVVLAARSLDLLKELSETLPGSYVIQTDMTKPEQIRFLIEETHRHFGRIDILINNAGIGLYSPIATVDINEFDYAMGLNVFGSLIAMQYVIPYMKDQGGGSIVNVSSLVTHGSYPNLGAYAATKNALNMLTMTARNELAEFGIKVGMVLPTVTSTDFSKNALKGHMTFERNTSQLPIADSPEKVALQILEAVETGEAEIDLR